MSKCQVIVSDGITLGHPCCGEFCCMTPLANNQDHFCPIHYALHNVCSVVGCNELIVDGTKSCTHPKHQTMERLKFQKGKAAFTLRD
ncbi:uncharacterized protein LACBIDRAFT_319161 [Laccaria bicolor S238N-H82]|uniref:Predicted protein n=1 Tax=Laccaria bicolor (strain S238N-H82 / ATCC MYA-4686) TaxID=486041 RepID=B0D803_LACBS|nr:uncharacterized protein LACBIDRAFT_319161 [Laccaria bicolor S238N-H82]EDR09733.1 predicted protein [Laccaria bicolor S238N-H82]|eukprot:XP_001880082.1 predicted protein [Laccaria bicolor S238N-H82]